MKQKFIVLFVLILLFVMILFVPYRLQAQETEVFRQDGIASWYGKEFDGRPTASGEIFDSSQLTAAHPSLPFGTVLVVTNRHNNKKVTVKVNDRGPFVAARIIDISKAAAEQIDMIVTGTAPVSVESIDKIAVNKPEPTRVSKPVQETAPPKAVLQNVAPLAPPAVTYAPVAESVYTQAPVVAQVSQIRLTPEINVAQNKSYRLQVGSYKNARNAVDAFEKLKNAGLNPAYERFSGDADSEYFRVVIAGIRGTDVQLTAEKIGTAGFREAVIREEN